MKNTIKILFLMIIISAIFVFAFGHNVQASGQTAQGVISSLSPGQEVVENLVTTQQVTITTPTNLISDELISEETKSQLVELKNDQLNSLKDYQDAYGSPTYGFIAFLLNKIRVYSIPFCILGIAISAIYQYMVGHRDLEKRQKGFNGMISIVTLMVLFQVLPLIFAIVVKGWRG